MAITDVLAEIKNYFFNWHTNNYVTLHTKETNQVTNQAPDKDYLVHSGAIKAADDAIRTDFTNADTNLQNQITSNKNNINTINGKLRTASYGTMPDVVEQSRKYYDSDTIGFNFPGLTSAAHDGFLTPKEKLDIYYFGKWYELTGAAAGFDSKHASHVTVWVNIGLRLVYFYFSYKDCPWLKNETEYFTVPLTDKNDPMWQILPVRSVWAPTNVDNVRMGWTNNGEFYLRSDTKITNKKSIYASMMWFYRDGPPSSKVGVYGTR